VVGFDDGIGIVLFGFASAIAVGLLSGSGDGSGPGFWALMGPPLVEVVGSLGVGIVLALGFSLLARRLSSSRDVFILTFAVILIAVGISELLHLSLILTNMIIGIIVVNSQPRDLVERIRSQLTGVMPLLFVLFFVLAGANLHVSALPSLGLIGLVYAICRSAGLIGGAWIGGTIARAEEKIRKYLGMGILSQAGVAIGLALIVKQEYSALGSAGEYIGATVITTITATSILFELVGPILTKTGLKKAGEIDGQ
jgi:Kef-type K+ transport system membrane component KefB